MVQCKYKALLRHMDALLRTAGVPTRQGGRVQTLYTAHSSRVAAVCSLLKAGLSALGPVLLNFAHLDQQRPDAGEICAVRDEGGQLMQLFGVPKPSQGATEP